MDDARGQVSNDAAKLYESFFVPALFAQWPSRVADAVALRAGERALDVACGTGVLARELARHTQPANVIGIDCNEGMLAVARQLAPEIDWRSGRAEALPFEDDRFDVVASQFGLMFFDDRVEALRQMWRVLRSGGRLAVAVWDSLERTPGYAAAVGLLQRLFGERVANELRAPYVLGDKEVVRSLFDEAGIAHARVDTVPGTARFASIEAWMRTDIKGWTLADMIDDEQYALLQQEAKTHLETFVGPDGRVAFDAPAHIAIATKA